MVNFLQTRKLASVMKHYISWLMFMKLNQQTMETMAIWWIHLVALDYEGQGACESNASKGSYCNLVVYFCYL